MLTQFVRILTPFMRLPSHSCIAGRAGAPVLAAASHNPAKF
jgi:hypothetical protein